ncbi:P-loop NTPase fold protein [[Flexibacter] sp. ATCC 35208]|uniref:KAP family P-loop NTPase fold protein n=1 Tax=[Flexibacter] sp. ATCC 35208 TaxID=1936242 RepID=UPI0009CBE7AE|nr:P-loop NTPase fold protein [[Flexibacter] sp. ATCC 35208]OMP74970.1 hypothetical protein BW716_32625 [[Flexibacter] sp. ATCC 35208]
MFDIADIKKRIPSTLWLSCCFGFLIFFIGPVNKLLNRFLVAPVISEFEDSWLNESILILLGALAAIWLFLFSERKFLRMLAILTALFYVLQLNQQFWQFQSMRLIPVLREWDIVVFAIIIPAILTFIPEKSRSVAIVDEGGFVEDLAIETAEQDTFKRKKVAAEIAGRISITNNRKSFAIGILGEYGSGKTSFINLIKNSLDKKNTEIIDFNPWCADGTPNIQKDFFDLLASRLYTLNPKISGMILDYSRKLSRVDSSMENFIRQISFVNNIFNKGSYTDDYDRINHFLQLSGKKIIITIDDLDRLYKEEVIEVMRLIRNTANFSNIFYLVAYERSYIQEAIKSMNANAGNSYLDKIFQLEIPLPKRENEDLLKVVESLLEDFISANDMEAYRKNIASKGFYNQYYIFFKTVFRQSRDVIKFVNNFKISYRLLVGEVLFEDLFGLELLKFRFPLIYDRLFERRDDIVELIRSNSSYKEYYRIRFFKNGKDEYPLIKRTLQDEKNYDVADIVLICNLLRALFLNNNNSRNAIIYPMFFERYFRYRLGSQDISEKQFQKAWKGGLEAVKQFINGCEEKKLLTELGMRIFQEKPKFRAGFELQIRSLFCLGTRYVKEKGRSSFDYDDLIELLWNYDNNVEKRYYANNANAYRVFVKSLFEEVEKPFIFPAKIIYHIKHGKKEVGLALSMLIDYEVRYFREHVAEYGLTKEASWMFWGIRDEYTEPVPEQPGYVFEGFRIEPSLIPYVKAALQEHDPIAFLKMGIQYNSRDRELASIYPQLLEIFDTPEEYRDLVKENAKINPDIKADFLGFFAACREKEFKMEIRYPFKTVLKYEGEDNDY